MGDYITSVLRTAVPALWGAVIAWLVGAELLPAELTEQAEGFAAILIAVAVAAYYALARLIERRDWAPRWLSRILLGSGEPPAYLGRAPAGAMTPEPPAA